MVIDSEMGETPHGVQHLTWKKEKKTATKTPAIRAAPSSGNINNERIYSY